MKVVLYVQFIFLLSLFMSRRHQRQGTASSRHFILESEDTFSLFLFYVSKKCLARYTLGGVFPLTTTL